MRIKNEEEWIGRSLAAMAELADAIVILDDGSTDRTSEICRSFPKVVRYVRQEEQIINEVRDKNRLLAMTLELEPDWVLALDGDEVLEQKAAATIRKEISYIDPANPQFTAFAIHILYFWNRLDRFRVDPGIYGDFWQIRLFTTWGQDTAGLAFSDTSHGGNFHCGSIPSNLAGRFKLIDVKVKHYGYFDPAQRVKKQQFYFQRDPEEAAKGYYDHLTSEKGMDLACWWERKGRGARGQHFIKSCRYFQNPRPELAELVPPDAKRVLDLGCGFGKLGELIKQRNPECKVYGVEQDQWAAQAAALRLQRVLTGNLETMNLPFKKEWFDCIILADLLEYLVDPWTLLIRISKFLHHQGRLIASLYNARNLFYIMELLKGKRSPAETGIHDPARLRTFTLAEAGDLFTYAGLEIREVRTIKDPRFQLTGERTRQKYTIETEGLTLQNLTLEDIVQMEAEQFILLAGKPAPRKIRKEPPLVSIIILTCNQLDYTRLCVESVLKHTRQPYELIMVDNGSVDGTPGYLQDIPGARIIGNQTNCGFAAGCNQGLAAAQGDYVVFLNNDVVVTEGWLENLLKWPEQYPAVGLVGPRTNYAVGLQKEEKVGYRELQGLAEFAREYLREHLNQGLEVDRLVGFCLLVKKDVIRKIGGFDARFGAGNFEDDDYCLRARAAGFKLIMAGDVYVHHFGSRTFIGEGIDYAQSMETGWRKFKAKWGIDPGQPMEQGYRPGELTGKFVEARHYVQIREQPGQFTKVDYSIIIVTYNSAGTITDCLESIFNNSSEYEVIVVDNASGDETPDRLHFLADLYPWLKLVINPENKGFAKAVNQGIAISQGDYVVLLNPDVQVTPGWLEKLRRILRDDIGAVGPVSDYAGGQQRIDFHLAPGNDITGLSNLEVCNLLARQQRPPVETKMLIGFCLMIPRKVLEQVGLDEDYFLGTEDLDLSWRLRLKGYRLLIATDVFIRHQGQASFRTEPEAKVRELVAQSTRRLVEKLKEYYGEGNVPTCQELWGVDWFDTRG